MPFLRAMICCAMLPCHIALPLILPSAIIDAAIFRYARLFFLFIFDVFHAATLLFSDIDFHYFAFRRRSPRRYDYHFRRRC